MDVNMPIMGGIELASEIKEKINEKIIPETRLYFITGDPDIK